MVKQILSFSFLGTLIIVIPIYAGMEIAGRDMSDMAMSEVIGYISMLLGLSVVFFGVKRIKKQYFEHKPFSFGIALKYAILIALGISTFYVVAWMIYSSFFFTDFTEQYMALQLPKIEAAGASEEEINSFKSQMEFYANPIGKILFTYMEILPLVVVVSLIVSLVLRKRVEGKQHNESESN